MRRFLVVALLLSVTSLVLGVTVLREPFAWAAAPFQNVIIANDTANPVPVAVGNLPAVQNVAVTNETANPVPVTVGNLPAVQNVAVQAPELWGKRVSLAGNNPAVFICPPAGKRFIVQSFSARATVPEGSHIVVYMRTGDFDSGVYLPMQNVGGSAWVGAVTGPVLAIVPAGCLFVAVEGFTNNLNGILDGYLLPA
jgi:hypothetical protein